MRQFTIIYTELGSPELHQERINKYLSQWPLNYFIKMDHKITGDAFVSFIYVCPFVKK